jgi:hypothetical protein
MGNKHTLRRLGGLAACAVLALAAGAARASWIDTTAAWDYKSGGVPFGVTGPATKYGANTYGQTFQAGPVDSKLDNFSFWVQDPKKAGALSVEAFVEQWDGHKAVGPALYDSGAMTLTPRAGYQKLTFKPALDLTPGQHYVAFLTTTTPLAGGKGPPPRVGVVEGSSVYGRGEFVYLDNGTDPTKLTTTNWQHPSDGRDLAFRAQFSSVPVSHSPAPSGLVLGLLGSGGLLARAWRVRRKRA